MTCLIHPMRPGVLVATLLALALLTCLLGLPALLAAAVLIDLLPPPLRDPLPAPPLVLLWHLPCRSDRMM